MSLRSDVEMEFDSHLMSCPHVKDFEMMGWDGDVNELPQWVDVRIWLSDDV